jgi:hypothetical protein
MKNNVIEFNKKNLEKLPVNSLYWDCKNSDDSFVIKTVESNFYNTTQYIVGRFYKSISPINL